MHRIVILGGGTGGTLAANRLRKVYRPDQADIFRHRPGRLSRVSAGLVVHPFRSRHHRGHHATSWEAVAPWHQLFVHRRGRVELESNSVRLVDGRDLTYDVLVIATGAVLSTDETEGLTGPGWMEKVFTFYTPEGASRAGACAERDSRAGGSS